MNLLILLPFALLSIPFIPTIIEAFKRKDKGPKDVPDQTTYKEKTDLDIPRLEHARGEARIKAPGDVIRIMGDASMPEGTEINNQIVVHGNLKVGRKSHVYGSVKVFGSIEISESSIVEGHVLSEGTIVIGRGCIIKGIVDSPKDIILEENAIVEAVSTEKIVKVGVNAKINKRISSGTSIVMSSQLPLEITEQVEQIKKKSKLLQPKSLENLHIVAEKSISRDVRSIQKEELSDDELIEMLIASKIRDELKKKILIKESEIFRDIQQKDFLNKWEKHYSFGRPKKKEGRESVF